MEFSPPQAKKNEIWGPPKFPEWGELSSGEELRFIFTFFLKIVNSYQVFLAKNVNSFSELIPTYLLVKSLIPALKGGGTNSFSPVPGYC